MVVRFGVIGCSRIAETSMIPAIKKSKFAELVFIGSRFNNKAKKFAEKFGCKNFGSYNDVFENNSVDAIYISTPVGLHEEFTIKAAKKKKHVLCEKSSTNSYQSAKKMVAEASKNKITIMEGLMFRFHPSHKKVLDLLKNNYLGKPFSFYGAYGFPAISKSDIRYNKKLGGGILNDAACYPICASRMIFGKEPTSVFSMAQFDRKSKVEDRISVILNYENNYHAHLISGYNLAYQNFYEIWGNSGKMKLSRAYNIPSDMKPTLSLTNSNYSKEIKIKNANHFVIMINDFCKKILGLQRGNFNFEVDLLNQAKVLESVRRSLREKREIYLSEIR